MDFVENLIIQFGQPEWLTVELCFMTDSFPTWLSLCIPWDIVFLNEGHFQPCQLLFSTLEIKAYGILTVEWFFFTGGFCMPRIITYYLLLDHYLFVNINYYCSDSIGLARLAPP